jgi:hypothetical protein
MNKSRLTALFSLSALPLLANANMDALDVRFEAKLNYRNSHENRYPTPFPPGSAHETVEAGEFYEASNFTVFSKWQMSENWQAVAKLDLIDLYERNPTSSDNKVDLDNLFIRYGTKYTHGTLPEKIDFYGQIGKFGKFERQEDRHLESYGLMSTAFNRLEDSGLEFGIDLPIGLYGKLSYTTGNPFFFRDPNALAGDNGVFKDPDKDIKPGIPILYDAEIEDFDLSENPETGIGLGYRWLNAQGNSRVNVLLFSYQRDMADSVELEGTVYGADLDLLVIVPSELPPATITSNVGLPIKGKDKKEHGLNIWLYQDNFAAFAQYVAQDAAGLKRDGYELELSYAFTNLSGIAGITPVVRYSSLKPDFVGHPFYPSPSVTWDWEKYDVGFNVDFNKDIRLTLEYAQNDFIRKNKKEDNNELLMTVRWRYDI